MSTLGTAPAFPPGARLAGGYVVIEHLSRTRRYDTYEVWSDERACSCVAKLARPDRREEEHVRSALVEEGERLLALAHPHLVRGYEVAPGPVVVMETLGGETLAHLLHRQPEGLEPEDVAWLGLQLASALHYLHGRGLLHLDVKPGNVVAEGGQARLIDLSLARAPGVHPAGLGTWCHCAPEQARGGEVGTAADVWGLGTVLFEAAAGEPAFADPPEGDEPGADFASPVTDGTEDDAFESSATWDTADQLAAGYPQLDAPAPPVASVRDVPQPLAEAIDACLAPSPDGRPQLPELADRLAPLAPGARRWGA
jgi:serine/threonine protein kinase